MRRFAYMLLLASVACSGKDGLAGPTGPQGAPGATGPAGAAGAGTRIVLTTTVAATGGASTELPAAAGTPSNPPALTCYVSAPGSNVLIVVASAPNSANPYCELAPVFRQPGQGLGLSANILGATPGYAAIFVVVY